MNIYPSEEYQKVLSIVTQSTKRTTSKLRKAGLWDWILSQVPKETLALCRSDSEIVYLSLHPSASPVCKYGNYRYFFNQKQGYGERCSNKSCLCRKEWRESDDWKARSKIAQKRREDTLEDKWGVRNPSHSAEIQKKKIETNQEHWGVDWAPQSKEVQEKNRATTLEHYGKEYFWQTDESRKRLQDSRDEHLEEILDKTQKTNLERWGTRWVVTAPYVQATIMNTNLDKRGVPYVRQDPAIQQQVRDTLMERYGVDTAMHIPGSKEKISANEQQKTGYNWPSQRHISKDIFDILMNVKLLKDFIDTYGVLQLEDMWGIGHRSIYKYAEQLGLEITHRNSYEIEIENWLQSLDIDFIKHDRKIIYPYELDFFFPCYNVAIEFQGDYWHMNPRIFEATDTNINMKRSAQECWDHDAMKSDMCTSAGVNLITIWEMDWNKQKDLIKQQILTALKGKE
jgi:hypothetical protein